VEARNDEESAGGADEPDTIDAADITSEFVLEGGASERKEGLLRILRGPAPGAIIDIPKTGSIVIGRSHDADVRLTVEGLSRRHARFFHLDGKFYAEDLESRNGTLVEGERLGSLPRRLSLGDRIEAGRKLMLVFELHDEDSKEASEALYRDAVRDALTGLYNRRYFEDRLRQELAFAARHGQPLSLIMIDLDHFKRVNDDYGHPAGDAVLRTVARVIQRAVRNEDIAARFGGEEICVLARGTSAGGGLALAERLRRNIESLPIRAGTEVLRVTASLGVGTFEQEGDRDLVATADEALYVSKTSGRNRCTHASEIEHGQ